ncbi:hypothetical protein [Kibdelosporangium philippinense]|nr:hypothetical protein [Kibdelosporangium philippinense]
MHDPTVLAALITAGSAVITAVGGIIAALLVRQRHRSKEDDQD